MRIITDKSEIDLNKLEEFVFNHPQGNFFQSIKALHFFHSVDNYDPILIVARTGDEIIGSLIAVVMKEGKGLKGYFSRRCIVWGGPLVREDDPDVWAGLLQKLGALISRKAIYTEFRNFTDQCARKELYRQECYRFNEHLNYIVPVNSLDKARAGLSNSKKRQINKSLKNGTQIVQAESLDQVESFYAVLSRLYREKIKKPIPHFGFFSRFFQDKSLGRYLLIKYEGQIIGGIMCPIYKDTIYEWFVVGKDGEIKGVYPSVLATWAAIEFAAIKGIKYFDFMGAGNPDQDYGVREFKSKFGGELVNFGRFVRINQNLHYQVGKLGLEILKRIK